MVDCEGWRYRELVEPEGPCVQDYKWPYWCKHVLRAAIPYKSISRLKLWYNNIPPGETVTCYLSPVKALPTAAVTIENPTVSVGGKTIVFPVTLKTGCYIEFNSMTDCRLYDELSALVQQVQPQGEVPILAVGENEVKFTCKGPEGFNARAEITVISYGEPLH